MSQKTLELLKLAQNAALYNVKYAKDVYAEVVWLINDIIDALKPLLSNAESLVKSAFTFSVVHIVMPLSYGILYDFLFGNLPACFMQLRTITETLVKAYYADTVETDFFETKLQRFEKLLKEKQISTSKVFKWLEKESPEASRIALRIWGKCSENWVHPYGWSKRFVDAIVKQGAPPAHSLGIPTRYSEGDRESLTELKKALQSLRSLLKTLFRLYTNRKT